MNHLGEVSEKSNRELTEMYRGCESLIHAINGELAQRVRNSGAPGFSFGSPMVRTRIKLFVSEVGEATRNTSKVGPHVRFEQMSLCRDWCFEFG